MRLVIGGSPCTHWSIAQTRNRETGPSGIGWDLFENYLFALDRHKADFFLYENNKSMSAAIREEITKRLGVEPICINSALVSAQNRQRLYWTNIPGVEQPEDRGILLRDILESGAAWREKGYTLRASHGAHGGTSSVLKTIKEPGKFSFNGVAEPVSVSWRGRGESSQFEARTDGKSASLTAGHQNRYVSEPLRIGTIQNAARNQDKHDSQPYRVYTTEGKSVTLRGQAGGVGAKTGLYATPVRIGTFPNGNGKLRNSQSRRIYSAGGKACALCARGTGGNSDTSSPSTRLYAIEAQEKAENVYEVRNSLINIKGKMYPIKLSDGFYIIRKLTVRECMRLQTVPEWYEFPVSDTQAYKMLGNGWTVDVIAHILSYCPGITATELDVLSMYDGMSCGHLALDKIGAKIERYRATEIDRYAIKTASHNFPDIQQLGDAFQVREAGWAG